MQWRLTSIYKKKKKEKKTELHKTLSSAEVMKPHRGAYGTGGGGGMYRSKIAGFSFLADLLAEPQGD